MSISCLLMAGLGVQVTGRAASRVAVGGKDHVLGLLPSILGCLDTRGKTMPAGNLRRPAEKEKEEGRQRSHRPPGRLPAGPGPPASEKPTRAARKSALPAGTGVCGHSRN